MDSSVNQTPAPFLQLMPIGWFRAEIQVLVKDTPRTSKTYRPLIMVFEDHPWPFTGVVYARSGM